MTREFHDIHREDEEAKQSSKRREGAILYDAQRMIPTSSESESWSNDDKPYRRNEDEEDSPPKKAKKSRKRKETILYDAQKMIPSSSESDDDDGDSPEEEEKVNDSLFQQSQAQFQYVEATSDDSDIQSQSHLK